MKVCVASSSMLVGKDDALSMKDRDASNPRARNRVRGLNSVTSVVNNRVTSITTDSFGPMASMLNAMMIVLLLAASTALEIGSFLSATI